jgi:hypothetical protein
VKTFLSRAIVFVVLSVYAVPGLAEAGPQGNRVIQYSAVRTASNPGYYFSGALIRMGVKLRAGDVKKDTFSAKARVTEHDGKAQGAFGNFGWDPQKESYALGEGWARWNILDEG